MKMIRTLTGVFVVALLAATAPSQASAQEAIDVAKQSLKDAGAIVMDDEHIDANYPSFPAPSPPFPPGTMIPMSFLMMQTVPCLGDLSQPLCANYANTAVTYAGFLWPGPPVPVAPGLYLPVCTPAAPPLEIPGFPPNPFFPLCAGAQLADNEALVLYGLMPPDSPYMGLQFTMHERHESRFPNYPDNVQPLKPAENPPDPASPGRVVVSHSIADTENSLLLPSGPNPDDPAGRDVFAHIVSGNAEVADMVSAALVAAGIPPEAIFVKELPPGYVLTADYLSDSFRMVMRIAEPIDPAEFAAWLRPYAAQGEFFRNPLEPFRVTVPESVGIGYTPFGELTNIDRSTGVDQKDGTCNIADKWEKYVKSKYGKPDVETVMTPRVYDDQFCHDTGTYCWGNNNDALYLNAMTKKEDAMQVYDLSGPDSRVVLAGIDSVAAGWADVWNWDIYDGGGEGKALETYLFSEAQADDYTADFNEFCGQNPSNCACDYPQNECGNWTDKSCAKDPEGCAAAVEHCRTNYPNPLDGKLYWAQIRQNCNGDPHCIELCSAFEDGSPELAECEAEPPEREIMNRLYLSPTTMTGPDWFESRHTRIFGYE
jgi:hypothetical protein